MIRQIFCDESRQTKDRYMVLGGIAIPYISLSVTKAQLQKIRDNEGIHAELKWNKVSSAYPLVTASN